MEENNEVKRNLPDRVKKGLDAMNSKSKKEHKSAKEEKIQYVLQLYAAGWKYTEVVEQFMTKFECTNRWAKKYLSLANERLSEKNLDSNIKSANKLALQYDLMYRMALEKGKLGDAIAALNAKKNLLGLDGVIKTANLNVEVGEKLDLSKLDLDTLKKLRDSFNIKSADDVIDNDKEDDEDDEDGAVIILK